MIPRLGQIILFEGDHRKVNAVIKNVTSFTSVSAVLKQGDNDVTSTYITSTINSAGNLILSDDIGGKATMPSGNYRYYITGVYSGKTRTWFIDLIVLPLDGSRLSDSSFEDYDPYLGDVVIYEGDSFMKSITIPNVDFASASALFKLDSTDITSTYCNGSVSVSGSVITTHLVGGAASIPAGDYVYFVSGVYNKSQVKATWYYQVKVLPKQSIL